MASARGAGTMARKPMAPSDLSSASEPRLGSASLKALPPEGANGLAGLGVCGLSVTGISPGGSGILAGVGSTSSPPSCVGVEAGGVPSSAHWKSTGRDARAAPVRKSVSLKLGKAIGSPSCGSPIAGSSPRRGCATPPPPESSRPFADIQAVASSFAVPPAAAKGLKQEKPVCSLTAPAAVGAASRPPMVPCMAPPGRKAPTGALATAFAAAASSSSLAAGGSSGSRDRGTAAAPGGRSCRGSVERADEDDDGFDDPGRVFAPANPVPATPLTRSTATAARDRLRAILEARSAGRPGTSSGSRPGTASTAASSSMVVPGGLAAAVAAAASGARRRLEAIAVDEELPPPTEPRIAWTEGGEANALAVGDDIENGDYDSSAGAFAEPDLEQQMRREALIRSILGDEAGPIAAGDDAAALTQGDGDTRWRLATPDGRRSAEALDRSLADSRARAALRQSELGGYLEALKQRRFSAGPPKAILGTSAAGTGAEGDEDTEPLVEMPLEADFDDIVDLNAQVTAMRRRLDAQAAASSAAASRSSRVSGRGAGRGSGFSIVGGKAGGKGATTSSSSRSAAPPSRKDASAEGASSGGAGGGRKVKLPSFLDKYLFEEKASEQLPHLALEAGGALTALVATAVAANSAGGGGDAIRSTARRKGLGPTEDAETLGRQIERLYGLLALCEVEGKARVEAKRKELTEAKERLRVEDMEAQKEKIAMLKQLKERGLVRNAMGASGTATPTPAASGGVKPNTQPQSQQQLDLVMKANDAASVSTLATVGDDDSHNLLWSGWSSSAAVAPEPPQPAIATSYSQASEAAASKEVINEDEEGEEPASGTFFTTSEGSRLLGQWSTHPPQAAAAAASSGSSSSEQLLASAAIVAVGAEAGVVISDDQKALTAGGVEVLETLQEEEAAGSDDAEDIPNPYEDVEAIAAIELIDKQLQALVPENEWEAKSLSSMPSSLPMLCGAGGGSKSSQRGGASSKARSVWSRGSALTDAPAPGDPTLRDQYESREMATALSAIDSRLQDLQLEALVQPKKHATPQELKKLLLEVAQAQQPPDPTQKVLSLTGLGTLDLGSEALVVAVPQLRENDKLSEAKRLLERLSTPSRRKAHLLVDSVETGDAAEGESEEDPSGELPDPEYLFVEAQHSLERLSEDVRSLEEQAAAAEAARSRLLAVGGLDGASDSVQVGVAHDNSGLAVEDRAGANADPDTAEAAIFSRPPTGGRAPIAARLEALKLEVASLIERKAPLEEFPRSVLEVEVPPATLDDDPAMVGAAEEVSEDEGRVSRSSHPILAGEVVPPALDLEMPADFVERTSDDEQGLWADEDLERLCSRLAERFGDACAPPTYEEIYSDSKWIPRDDDDDGAQS